MSPDTHLGAVQGAQRLVPPAADLPQGGPEAPLVGRLAQVASVLDALGGHPGDTLHEHWGGEERRGGEEGARGEGEDGDITFNVFS